MKKYHGLWPILYLIYPPVLRIIEKTGLYTGQQDFHVGFIRGKQDLQKIRFFLKKRGFEDAILAWKDTGEVLSMRRVHDRVFQHHIRIFGNGEVRGHYEYAPEGNPLLHIFEKHFEPDKKLFTSLMRNFLK